MPSSVSSSSSSHTSSRSIASSGSYYIEVDRAVHQAEENDQPVISIRRIEVAPHPTPVVAPERIYTPPPKLAPFLARGAQWQERRNGKIEDARRAKQKEEMDAEVDRQEILRARRRRLMMGRSASMIITTFNDRWEEEQREKRMAKQQAAEELKKATQEQIRAAAVKTKIFAADQWEAHERIRSKKILRKRTEKENIALVGCSFMPQLNTRSRYLAAVVADAHFKTTGQRDLCRRRKSYKFVAVQRSAVPTTTICSDTLATVGMALPRQPCPNCSNKVDHTM